MTRIIVCHEKHGEQYWDASTDEAWAASSLAILTERFNEGYWYHEPPPLAEDWNIKQLGPVLRDEEIAVLPPHLQPMERQKRQKQARFARFHAHRVQEYAELKRIVEEKDLSFTSPKNPAWRKPLAWAALEDRSDHEYERVELETVRSVTIDTEAAT